MKFFFSNDSRGSIISKSFRDSDTDRNSESLLTEVAIAVFSLVAWIEAGRIVPEIFHPNQGLDRDFSALLRF